jgi:tetratricopeptide (TPR) repeat protein
MLAVAPSGGETRDAYAISARDFASIYRSISGRDPLPPPEVAELRRACNALSAELGAWRQFMSARANLGWIDYGDETPPVTAWRENNDFLTRAAPESLTGNLKIVYQYFGTLKEAYDQIQGHLKEETSYKSKPNFRDPQAAVVEGLTHITMFAGYQGAFHWNMRRKQAKDQEFQNRLLALPGALSTLSYQLDTLGKGSFREEQRQLEAVRIPALPRITTSGRSISFELVPVQTSQETPAAGAESTELPLRKGVGSRVSRRETELRETIRLNPDNAAAHNELGQLLLMESGMGRKGVFDEAEAAFREAIRLNPGNADAHWCLGKVLRERDLGAGDVSGEAEAAFREAIRLDPGHAGAHCDLGILLRTQDYYAEAEAEFGEAIRLDPDSWWAHSCLAIVLYKQGRTAEMEAPCRESIRLNPDIGFVHFLLGEALSRQKRHREADAAYKEAARLDPDFRSEAGGAARIRRRRARFFQ